MIEFKVERRMIHMKNTEIALKALGGGGLPEAGYHSGTDS